MVRVTAHALELLERVAERGSREVVEAVAQRLVGLAVVELQQKH